MESDKPPRVSVNIPVYNGEKTIAQAVQSILSQTFTDFELIIIDDASTDSTSQILSKFADPRIRVIRHERNQGISRARNTALRNSNGDYIMILDADDIALPDRMMKQVQVLDRDPSLDGLFSWHLVFTDNPDETVAPPFQELTPSELCEMILFVNPFSHSTACVRRRVMGTGYREDLDCGEDYAKWLELIFSGKRLGVVPEPLVKYWAHPPSHYSREKMRAAIKKLHIQYFKEVFSLSLSDEEAETHGALYEWSDYAPSSRAEAVALLSKVEHWVAKLDALGPHDSGIVREHLADQTRRRFYILAAYLAPLVGLSVMRFSRHFPPIKRLKLLVKSLLPMPA